MNRKLTIGLLFSCLVLLFACDVNKSDEVCAFHKESHFEESQKTDIPQRLEELSNEFKGRTCVLPRRSVQVANFLVKVREQKSQKTFLQNRLNGENQLYKIVELNTDCQIIQFATLLCRRGYYVYALRKLLI
ncbi:MAG: hypothetical protein LBV72_17665 [Tannerella sp.]|nr:hypothetical protein [Tannerella sp.]